MRCSSGTRTSPDIRLLPRTYPGIGRTRPSASVPSGWSAPEVDGELVYGITKALWHENARQLLDNGHAKGQAKSRSRRPLEGVAVPMHPGSE